MKFIDLSTPIYNNHLGELPIMAPQIEYSDHDTGTEQMSFIYPKIIPDQHLPLGKGWATETITLGTHSGTHMDAPWHYAPIQDR
jgi:kynurenine formamidase